MITKKCWNEMIFELLWVKGVTNYNWKDEVILRTYITFILLSVLTPVIIILDLLLLPFEIGYYFFKKSYINREGKSE